jgi:hypothetical protein
MALPAAVPHGALWVSRIAFIVLGLLMLISGLYSVQTGRPGIMRLQYFARDRQTVRTTPARLLRMAGLGGALFGVGALIWAAVGYPPSNGDLIGLGFVLAGLVLLVVVGISVPYTRRGRLVNAAVTALIVVVLYGIMWMVWPNPFRPR